MDPMDLLPCGHVPITEEDNIILDWCPECGWKTPYRREADKLNELATKRVEYESALIDFVRHGEWKESLTGHQQIMTMARKVRTAYVAEETQRVVAKYTGEEEREHQ